MNIESISNYFRELLIMDCNRFLKTYGWTGELTRDFDKTLLNYFAFKDIFDKSKKKWKCIENPELSFSEDIQNGYDNLKQALVSGENLDKYMSKGIFRGENDPMFNDWGILHFHLGNELETSNKFVKRTGELAFVRFHKDSAYIIAIGKHGDWTKQALVATLHKYWRYTLESSLNNLMTTSHDLTDYELSKLRESNINVPLIMDDGEVYMLLNGGLSTAGNRTAHSHSLIEITNSLTCMAEYIVKSNIFHDVLNLFPYCFRLTDTFWGLQTTGIAFRSLRTKKYLSCIAGVVKYEEDL